MQKSLSFSSARKLKVQKLEWVITNPYFDVKFQPFYAQKQLRKSENTISNKVQGVGFEPPVKWRYHLQIPFFFLLS
jgi:hypothetical protein